MKRIHKKKQGYDCVRHPCGVNGCGTHSGSNHGIDADKWCYAVSDGQVALSLVVVSCDFPSSVSVVRPLGRLLVPTTAVVRPLVTAATCTYYRNERPGPWGTHFCVHANFPIERELLRMGAPGSACDFVDGRCYVDNQFFKAADEFYERHGGIAYEQAESFWLKLEEAWHEYAKPLYDQRVDTKYERCRHCDGLGTVLKGQGVTS